MTKSANRKAHDAAKAAQEPMRRMAAVRTNQPMQAPFAPVVLTQEEYACFSILRTGSVQFLMPDESIIPHELKDRNGGKYHDVVTQWFFRGLGSLQLFPGEEEIEAGIHLRHLTAIMRSEEPSHEYKMAAIRFLLDTWFETVVWTPASQEPSP